MSVCALTLSVVIEHLTTLRISVNNKLTLRVRVNVKVLYIRFIYTGVVAGCRLKVKPGVW